jgi:peptide/nickel transport system permease protein
MQSGSRNGRKPLPPVPVLEASVDLEELAPSDRPETFWRLVWRKFRRHKMALAGAMITFLFYFGCVLFGDFVAPHSLEYQHRTFKAAPPQVVRWVDSEGKWHLRPFVYGYKREMDPKTLERVYMADTTKKYPIKFFIKGDPYKLLGVLPASTRLFGTDAPGHVFLFGTDRVGRDLFSRIIYGGRISLTIGLAGVAIYMIVGSIIGTLSGFYGGWIDTIVQRVLELFRAFPEIPLWMALGAAIPKSVDPTLVLGFVAMPGMSRIVRGMVLSLRERDFVMAATGMGASDRRIIFRHLLPNTASFLVVEVSLQIPRMILTETALSFLGLGLRPPVTSWGVLLEEARQVRVIAEQPWLIIPAFFVIFFVLALNFMGDGLRDAADPYSN